MKNEKIFNVRMSRDLWAFLKKKGVDREMSLNEIILDITRKYRDKCEKKLTDDNTIV